MNLGFFIKWFILMINLMGLFCADKTLYGIVLVRYEKKISSLQYRYRPRNKLKLGQNQIEYNSVFDCLHTDTIRCINHIKVLTGMKNIPDEKIFIRIFYNFANLFSSKAQKSDRKFIKNYLSLVNVQPLEIFDMRTYDILTFGQINLNLRTEKMNPWISLIFRDNKLFISFINQSDESITPALLDKIKYKSEKFNIFANTFTCASPSEVNVLIFNHLFRNRGALEEIPHPCLPPLTNITLKYSPGFGECAPKVDFKTTITFVGHPDELECHKLIKIAINRPEFNTDVFSTKNFDNINLPFAIPNTHKLVLFTSLIKRPLFYRDLYRYLRKHKLKSCFESSKETIVEFSIPTCFQLMYLRYILSDIVPFVGRNWELRDDEPEGKRDKLALIDARFGFFIIGQSDAPPPYEEFAVLSSSIITYTSNTPSSIVDQSDAPPPYEETTVLSSSIITFTSKTPSSIVGQSDAPPPYEKFTVLSSSIITFTSKTLSSIVGQSDTTPPYNEESTVLPTSTEWCTSSTKNIIQISNGIQITIVLIIFFIILGGGGTMVYVIYKKIHKKEDDL